MSNGDGVYDTKSMKKVLRKLKAEYLIDKKDVGTAGEFQKLARLRYANHFKNADPGDVVENLARDVFQNDEVNGGEGPQLSFDEVPVPMELTVDLPDTHEKGRILLPYARVIHFYQHVRTNDRKMAESVAKNAILHKGLDAAIRACNGDLQKFLRELPQ